MKSTENYETIQETLHSLQVKLMPSKKQFRQVTYPPEVQ